MADVLICGGGVAGSTLAILLGRRGMQVELFERGHFPREKPCGEGLMPAGVAVLNRLGVGEAVGGTHRDGDRKSTRLNSSHQIISYAVFCLKKKKNTR